jgi:hypothetical protein
MPKQVHVEPIFNAGYCRTFHNSPSAYRIQNALQQTPVISEDFKAFIISWMVAAVDEAYEAGRASK